MSSEIATAEKEDAINVLALDGGGMRGLYAVALLETLASRFGRCQGESQLDVGAGFDLIVGTSTGGILAAGLAAGVELERIGSLYREHGPEIFVDPIPPYSPNHNLRRKGKFWLWVLRHLGRAGNGNEKLRSVLKDTFGDETLGQVYARRAIGLCITATALLRHSPRVFKTPHLDRRDRDDRARLVDVCLATSAAPIYLPVVAMNSPVIAEELFVDGGLWANSPVLVGLLEGLATAAPGQAVNVLSVGTCAPVKGSAQDRKLDRGVGDWRAGAYALNLAMDAQADAAQNVALLLEEQLARLGKTINILRCEETSPSADQAEMLQLDSATPPSLALLQALGENDGHATYRWHQLPGDQRGSLLAGIFGRMPTIDHVPEERN